MSIGTLLIRADASVSIGTGHVMRCLALAQAWQDRGGQCVFIAKELPDALRKRLVAEGCDVVEISAAGGTSLDAEQTVAAARDRKCDWVVVDGYSFRSQYQAKLKTAGSKILFLDDYGHGAPYVADMVLNQNVTATREIYSDREVYTRLLIGTRYCLLRREFSRWRDWRKEIPREGARVLLLMGGSDPGNITARILRALSGVEFRNLEIVAVVGGSNLNLPTLDALAARMTNVVLKKGATEISGLMANSDLAISAAGSTCWELCFMGLPALLLDVAENQTLIARELHRRGCAIHVGDATVTSAVIGETLKPALGSLDIRQSLSNRSRSLVDGYGAARVVSILRGESTLRLRRVRSDDARVLWEWANDPEVRAGSFSSSPISWESHIRWFGKNSERSTNLFLIAEDASGCAIGQIRFDLDGSDATLNFSIAKERRGLGMAARLVEQGLAELWAQTGCQRVHALVKTGNLPSARTFEKAGFVCNGSEQIRGVEALHFIHRRG